MQNQKSDFLQKYREKIDVDKHRKRILEMKRSLEKLGYLEDYFE